MGDSERSVYAARQSVTVGKLMEKGMMFRFLYVILIGGLAFLFPVGMPKDESRKWFYASMTLLTASMLVIGFSRLSHWYNLFVFPCLFAAYTLLVIKTLPYFIRKHVKSEESIFGLSNEESPFYFRFETANGPLTIHNPNRTSISMAVRGLGSLKVG